MCPSTVEYIHQLYLVELVSSDWKTLAIRYLHVLFFNFNSVFAQVINSSSRLSLTTDFKLPDPSTQNPSGLDIFLNFSAQPF